MVKISAWVHYPWPGVPSDEHTEEIDDAEWAGMTAEQRNAVGGDLVATMIQNQIDAGWEVVED